MVFTPVANSDHNAGHDEGDSGETGNVVGLQWCVEFWVPGGEADS